MLDILKSRAAVIGELFSFLWKRKMWWSIPIVSVLLLLTVLLLLASTSSAFAPFIYTLF